MIYASIVRGRLQLATDPNDRAKILTFSLDDRPRLVVFLRDLLSAGWDGHMMSSSSMNWPEEDGWRGNVTPHEFIAGCLREASGAGGMAMNSETACAIVEACGNDGDENAMTYAAAARYLAQRVRETETLLTGHDTLSRELAELEHTHEQLCVAAVALSDERDDLRRRLDASQKELLRALAEAEGAVVLSRSASDEPLGETTTHPRIACGQRWRRRAGPSDDVWEIVHWDCNKDDWEVTVRGPVSAEICTDQTLPWELFHTTWELCEFALISVPSEELREPPNTTNVVVPTFAPTLTDSDEPEDGEDLEEEHPEEPLNTGTADFPLNGDIVVSAEEFAALQDILENPPPPTPALVALMRETSEAEAPPPAPPNQGKKKKRRDRP